MTCLSSQRLALLLLAATALGSAGFGTCAFDSGAAVPATADGGPPPTYDLGFAGSAAPDAGAVSDLGAAPLGGVQLTAPQPLSSNLAITTSFDFAATLFGKTPDALEPLVSIKPHAGGTALQGAFSWKQTGPNTYSLELIPTGLVDKTDYVVRVTDPDFPGRDLVHTGVSVGSHPRVRGVELFGENNATRVYFKIYFSEPMNATLLATKVGVSSGSGTTPTAVTGRLSAVTETGVTDGTEFRYDLDQGKGLAQPITLHVKSSAVASTGVALDPASWDSTTADGNGDFYVDFIGVTLDNQPGMISWRWDPTVK